MNRKTAAAAAGMLTAGLVLFFGALRVPAESQQPSAAPVPYILREYKGRLAVFETGKAEPIRVIDLDIRMLPPYDQGLLRAGIDAADAQELSRLLEDYTS